eukprot:TRINITY_DN8165_c0_g1_i1.p1 TRINITY_DN8165_c0_g1~~TRINITY_DN8165_c0_g1_i1.p1  ORF type:complete len:331 (+),score=106.98 TRINITY_DN8165_c0_g1_i1:12-1004(+)
MSNTFVLEAPGVEDKWYSITRVEADLQKQSSKSPLKIGRVGAHIRKYEALPNVSDMEQRKKFLKKLQDERKNLSWKLQDATGQFEYDGTAEETTAVFYVVKKKPNSPNICTVHRCYDWYEFRKAPRPAVLLSYDEANKMMNSKDPSKFEEKMMKWDAEEKKEEDSDDDLKVKKKDEEEGWEEGEFGEVINDENKEERVKGYKSDVKAVKKESLTDYGRKMKKTLDGDSSSASDGELEEFQRRYEAQKGAEKEKEKEAKGKKRKKEVEEAPVAAPAPVAKKARMEHISEKPAEDNKPLPPGALSVEDFKTTNLSHQALSQLRTLRLKSTKY